MPEGKCDGIALPFRRLSVARGCPGTALLFFSTFGREFGMLALRVRASGRAPAPGNGAVSLRAADAVCGAPGIQQQARGVS